MIPDNVTNIGSRAFDSCTSLKEVTLSKSLIRIDSYAFYNCSALTGIIIPDSVTTIGVAAFWGCKALAKLELSETLERIEDSAFYECKALTEVTIPESVTFIGINVFVNCDALTKAEIKGSGSVGSGAFEDCDALTSLTISDQVTSIGNELCYGCDKLSEVKFGRGIQSIPDSAFRLCGSLETVTIPRYCATIASNAFAEDTKLTSVYIPASVTSIQSNTFSYPAKMTIYGKESSYAQEYAASKSIAFSAVNQSITTIAFADSAINMARSSTVTPSMQIMPDFDTDTITFTSSDTGVATVSEVGSVYANGYGTATITAQASSGKKTSLTVVVVKPADSITLDKTVVNLGVGESVTVKASLSPADTRDSITWKSSNTSVATVDSSGKITSVREGTAVITAVSVYGSKTATCTVTVQYNTSVTDLTVTPSGNMLNVRLTATQLPSNAFVYIAAYNSAGDLVNLSPATLSGGTAEAVIPKSGATLLRAFIWRENGMKPLTAVREYTL